MIKSATLKFLSDSIRSLTLLHRDLKGLVLWQYLRTIEQVLQQELSQEHVLVDCFAHSCLPKLHIQKP
jgi:hypothetical protein